MPHAPQPLISSQAGALKGAFTPPGDKSISHRAVMLGEIAEGVTTINGLLEGEDVLCTVAALEELGAEVKKGGNGIWTVKGTGLDGMRAPQKTLDMGNSGTAVRLLIGLLSGRPFPSTFTGDASLRKRPMSRVITPLKSSGAGFQSKDGMLPITVAGAQAPRPIHYRMSVPSAQVKSAILLAGLSANGVTSVIEEVPTRDHSENMLRHFGAKMTIQKQGSVEIISIKGKAQLRAQTVNVPADPSSAAFPLVAALLHPGSQVTLKNVGTNARRTGLFKTLIEMGANITFANKREDGGEPIADILVDGGKLKGVIVPPERAPSMIDEYPILAVAAACANGVTRMKGLGELRVKESDRLSLMAEGLRNCGVKVAVEGDDLIVTGNGQAPQGGVTIRTEMDHRIAMSFLVLGSVTAKPVQVDDGSFIATSFPGFVEIMNGMGMKIAGL